MISTMTGKNILKIMALCTVMFTGCRTEGTDYNRIAAHQLYEKSVRLIELYTDSVKISTDSLMLQRLSMEFDDRLAKINFQFPADTDQHLTEQENDSIICLMDSLVSAFRIKGEELAARSYSDSDSTSISQSAQLK